MLSHSRTSNPTALHTQLLGGECAKCELERPTKILVGLLICIPTIDVNKILVNQPKKAALKINAVRKHKQRDRPKITF